QRAPGVAGRRRGNALEDGRQPLPPAPARPLGGPRARPADVCGPDPGGAPRGAGGGRRRPPGARPLMPRVGELDVFPLCLGGNVFGWTADERASFEVLDAFVEGGGNLIDTADQYSAFAPGNHGGESETIIGRWLAARGARDRVLLASKVGRRPGYEGL